MSRYKRLPRVKEKKTDEFVSLVDHAIRLGIRHKSWLLAGVLVAVVLGGLFFLLQSRREAGLIGLAKDWSRAGVSDLPISLQPLTKIKTASLLMEAGKGKEAEDILAGFTKEEEVFWGYYPSLLRAEAAARQGHADEAKKIYEEISKESDDPVIKKAAEEKTGAPKPEEKETK